MIKISRDEAAYIRQNGQGEHVHTINATHKKAGKTYYLSTAPKAMKLLEGYRSNRIVKSFGG